MKTKISIVLISLSVFVLVGFTIFRIDEIPKVWDIEQLESMHLPYPDTSVKLGFFSEEYYNNLPERISYKTYPFYMPAMNQKVITIL